MKTIKVTFYHDSAHGWYRVKRSVLEELNLLEHISSFSYVNGASSNTIKGLDERNLSFLNITEPSEEDIFLNYCKYNLLSLFLDSDKSIIEKIDQFNKNIHLFSNEVHNIMNITNGGLMDEWNYEKF